MTNGRCGYALRRGPPFSPCNDTNLLYFFQTMIVTQSFGKNTMELNANLQNPQLETRSLKTSVTYIVSHLYLHWQYSQLGCVSWISLSLDSPHHRDEHLNGLEEVLMQKGRHDTNSSRTMKQLPSQKLGYAGFLL